MLPYIAYYMDPMGWFIQFIPHGKESRCFINLFLLVWQGMVILLPAWDCGHYWLCSKRPDIKILERFCFFLRGKAALRFARTKTKRGVPIRSEANGLHVCMGTRGSDSSDWNPSFVSIDTSEDWCSHLDLDHPHGCLYACLSWCRSSMHDLYYCVCLTRY